MGTKTVTKSGKVVYCVNKRLSIRCCDIAQLSKLNKDASSTDEHEIDVSVLLDHLPMEIKGNLYFETEDEAQNFIKMQIGM